MCPPVVRTPLREHELESGVYAHPRGAILARQADGAGPAIAQAWLDHRKNWRSTDQNGVDDSKLFEVPAGSPEFNGVAAEFARTLPYYTIDRLDRVENGYVQEAFEINCAAIERQVSCRVEGRKLPKASALPLSLHAIPPPSLVARSHLRAVPRSGLHCGGCAKHGRPFGGTSRSGLRTTAPRCAGCYSTGPTRSR